MLSMATQLTYQHIVLFARQLPLAERVRLCGCLHNYNTV